MARRQIAIFTIGCWAAIATAALHLVGHVSGPTAATDEAGRQLLELATTYTQTMPGGSERSLMDFLNGFSLSFSVFLALMGGLGLIVLKRGREDATLMMAVARAMALASLVLVVISLSYWFIVPSLLLALVAVCFLTAGVRPPS